VKRPFYGWIITASAMMILFISNGLIISGIRVFDTSLLETFSWSRGALTFRDFLTFAIAGLLGPIAGALADRYGVKRLMLVGAALLFGLLLAYSRLNSKLGLYAIHIAFAAVLASCGLIVSIMLVSRWFVARRGTALGITVVGTSLGGIAFPQLGTWLIQKFGWRQAFAYEAIFPILLILIVVFLVREFPSDLGLTALGASSDAGGTPPIEHQGLAYGEALRTPTFWALAFAAGTTFYAIMAAVAHLFLHGTDLGFSPQKAGSILSLAFGMALIGKFSFGMLADFLNQKAVFLGNLFVMLIGGVLLATLETGLFLPAIILFGLGWGGLYTLIQLLTIESFGLKAAGKILGTITVVDAIGGGLGSWVTGLLYDRTGSYQVPFALLAVLVFLALLAATQVRPSAPPGGENAG
jgi:MFS family permease